jgi:tRNA(Leu) C34 or U34 (ribose-2'-O)-methylase TrmL
MNDAAVLLIDPKYGHNLGSAVRACAVFGVPECRWTGWRGARDAEARLPREERLRDYRRKVAFGSAVDGDRPIDWFAGRGLTPVAVERRQGFEVLGGGFLHPERALYVFGPEDGDLERGTLGACHRFVTIPGGCLNLGAAVNVVLYDRQRQREGGETLRLGLAGAVHHAQP